MRPAMEMKRYVVVQTAVRIVDLDESVVDPTIISDEYPRIEYRDLAVISSHALLPNDSAMVPELALFGDNCLAYRVDAGTGLHTDEADIVRAIRACGSRKDETGNDVRLTMAEFIEAMQGMGIVLVESLDREVVRSE